MKSNDKSYENKKKKGITFKASSSQIEEKIKDNDDSDEKSQQDVQERSISNKTRSKKLYQRGRTK